MKTARPGCVGLGGSVQREAAFRLIVAVGRDLACQQCAERDVALKPGDGRGAEVAGADLGRQRSCRHYRIPAQTEAQTELAAVSAEPHQEIGRERGRGYGQKAVAAIEVDNQQVRRRAGGGGGLRQAGGPGRVRHRHHGHRQAAAAAVQVAFALAQLAGSLGVGPGFPVLTGLEPDREAGHECQPELRAAAAGRLEREVEVARHTRRRGGAVQSQLHAFLGLPRVEGHTGHERGAGGLAAQKLLAGIGAAEVRAEGEGPARKPAPLGRVGIEGHGRAGLADVLARGVKRQPAKGRAAAAVIQVRPQVPGDALVGRRDDAECLPVVSDADGSGGD